MRLFKGKEANMPVFSKDQFVPVLRCSICTGEQVLCLRDKESGDLRELMLIRSPSELEKFCKANGLEVPDIEKVY